MAPPHYSVGEWLAPKFRVIVYLSMGNAPANAKIHQSSTGIAVRLQRPTGIASREREAKTEQALDDFRVLFVALQHDCEPSQQSALIWMLIATSPFEVIAIGIFFGCAPHLPGERASKRASTRPLAHPEPCDCLQSPSL
jgi:hypothetical protein